MMINNYKKNSTKKWVVCFIFTLLGILPSFLPYAIYRLTNSWSNRIYLDLELLDYFGEFKISDSVSDEVLIISFDWNSA